MNASERRVMAVSRMQFISSAQQEIQSFGGPYSSEKQKLALEMMDVGLAWTSIASSSGFERKRRNQYKQECKRYILANYNPEPQVVGFIGASIVFWFLFRWALSWVIFRIVDNYVIPINDSGETNEQN